MTALDLVSTWPVEHVSAAVVRADGSVDTIGPRDHPYRLASIAKPITAWASLIAVEEGILGLDEPIGQPGCTVRHLLAHAGGYPFTGTEPIARPGVRRIYSNTGIEMVADAVAIAAHMPFVDYLTEAVLAPLGMAATELRGSPAHGMWSTLDDVVRFVGELMAPRLISAETATMATTPAFPQLAGIVPDVGRFDPCPWGLGIEVRGGKQPHWTATGNSAATFGHFGGSGTFLWVDPGARGARGVTSALACVALTDRPFDDWTAEALALWPAFGDQVLADHLAGDVADQPTDHPADQLADPPADRRGTG